MQRAYKPCELRNSGQAFRRFRTAGAFAGGRKLTAGLIALIAIAVLIGCLITFWPR